MGPGSAHTGTVPSVAVLTPCSEVGWPRNITSLVGGGKIWVCKLIASGFPGSSENLLSNQPDCPSPRWPPNFTALTSGADGACFQLNKD